MSKCEFGKCENDGTETRISEVNGETYSYCPEHDPLPCEGFSELDT